MSDESNKTFIDFYSRCFATHGASARGVDWHNTESLHFHYDKILSVIDRDRLSEGISLLDIGCGYGGLLLRAKENRLKLDYTGIDLVGETLAHGRAEHPEATFLHGDFLNYDIDRKFDYVVANGVLTEKLDLSLKVFRAFTRATIKKMFELSNVAIAFNMMTSHVNFYADNLYYENPGDIIYFCASEMSSKFRIDHSYPHYDFTMFVYR